MEAHALRAHPRGGFAKAGPLRRIASDERLVDLVRGGDDGAFAVLFERYQRQILSFCRHMLASREEAEDAAQHAFLSAYNGIRASDRPIQLRPWLYTIARNHCLSQLRSRRETASLDDVEPAVEGLAAEVQRRADLREMLRDLAELPEDQRAALVLAELGDLSHAEIADVVGCPKDKVKALVFQARSSLAASRQARDTSCQEVREQLSVLSGGSLRRTTLRRHLRECDGCRAFRAEVRRQRQAMAILLPVLPTAGLKTGVLSGIGTAQAAAGAGAAGGAGGLISGLASGGAIKLAAAAALAAGGIGGGVAAVDAVRDGRTPTAPNVTPAPAASAAATREALGVVAPPSTPSSAAATAARAGGTHAPGRQSGGVANGRNPKGDRGRSQTAPGRAGTAPGRAGTSPGRSGATPGRSGIAPGRARSERPAGTIRPQSAPGRLRAPSTGTTTRGSAGAGSSAGTVDATRGTSRVAPDLGARGSSGAVPDVAHLVRGAK